MVTPHSLNLDHLVTAATMVVSKKLYDQANLSRGTYFAQSTRGGGQPN